MPEKRNIGVITKRKSGLKTSLSDHAEIADTGAANASPTSDGDGGARIAARRVHRAERRDHGEVDRRRRPQTRVAT